MFHLTNWEFFPGIRFSRVCVGTENSRLMMIGETTTAVAAHPPTSTFRPRVFYAWRSITLGESNLPPPGVVGCWAPGRFCLGMLFSKKKMVEDGTCIITLGRTCWTSSARAIPTAPGQIHTHKTRTYAALLLYNIGRKTLVCVCSNLAAVQILFIYTYIREASTQKTRGISPPPARLVYILAAAVPVGASQAGSPRVKIKSKCYDIIWRSFSFSFSLHTFRHQMVSPSISHLMLGKEEERKKRFE